MATRFSQKRKGNDNCDEQSNKQQKTNMHQLKLYIDGSYTPLQKILKEKKIEIGYGWDEVSFYDKDDKELCRDKLVKFEIDTYLKVIRINNKGKKIYIEFSHIEYNDLIISFTNSEINITSKKACDGLLTIIPKKINAIQTISYEDETEDETEAKIAEVNKETTTRGSKTNTTYISGTPIAESDDDADDADDANDDNDKTKKTENSNTFQNLPNYQHQAYQAYQPYQQQHYQQQHYQQQHQQHYQHNQYQQFLYNQHQETIMKQMIKNEMNVLIVQIKEYIDIQLNK